MKKTIGVFAHVDAGKTTFSEQLLYHTKTIRKLGRVDNKNSFLDSHFIERERGITIYSDIARFNYNDNEYFLVDTPGHIDFSTEMERTISILDYAILIVSAIEGIQGHTETVWKLLRENNVPTFIFINKIDREGSNIEGVYEEIKRNLSNNTILLDYDSLDNISEELIEFLSERDENILEDYMNENISNEKCIDSISKMIKSEKAFVCMCGSALLDIGIKEFINFLDKLTFTEYIENNSLRAKVSKIRYDKDNNRVVFLKIVDGNINVKDTIEYEVNGEVMYEKINAIRIYNGEKYEIVNKAIAGDTCGVIGLSRIKAGMVIGDIEKRSISLIPTLSSKVIFDSKLNPKEVLKYFRFLEDEDETLNVIWNEEIQELTINIMGEIQLEVLKEVCLERFKLKIDFGDPKILYKETIKGVAYGYGHFEPLKHYAEVHLKLEELPAGSGIQFESTCHTDNLNIGQMNLVKTHIFEREHRGILTGSPITDIKITLTNGRAHLKHTEGGDFREATKRALRQGLEYANNMLLEPYYKFNIKGDMNLMGRFISDIEKMKGSFNDPIIVEDKVIISGIGPVETFRKYPLELQSISKGKARISLVFGGYMPCHNSDKVIKNIGYDKNKDSEYTSSSIFCSKGVGYSVEASEVKSHMHAEIIE